ncbi:MAG TPA: GNAT family N-acetyltransferase [Aggregatilineaceae bacterium]|nr:GNAT family N-acetyltransferase [Aggregatilineaceae bacterium]
MQIVPFEKEFLPDAAALFAEKFKVQREAVPSLPDTMGQVDGVIEKLGYLAGDALVAVEQGKLIGYLGAYLIPGFRGTSRKAAYCPEWGHGAADAAVYRALYRAAAERWTAEGCTTHGISVLATDHAAENVWYWSGFGLTVVDAVRPITPLNVAAPTGYTVRQATRADAERLAEIEAEHWQHYRRSPVFMMSEDNDDAAGFVKLLENPNNGVWVAENGPTILSYMRFEGSSFGAADIVNDAKTTAITGAYTRPAYRGQGAAVVLLDAALHDYAARGYARCAVDFESLNPEAAYFWMKYFQPVNYSLLRMPEALLG